MNRRWFVLAGAGVLVSGRSAMAQSGTPVVPDDAGDALYRLDLDGDYFPPEPVVAGVVAVSMTAGTSVSYAEGASPESLAIDHVLTGGYTVETGSDTLLYSADGSEQLDVPGGESVTVESGETLVLVDNEAEQQFTVGDEDTTTLTVGFFTLNEGTNESTVDGDLSAAFLAGSQPTSMPDSGVTVAIVPAQDEEAWPDAVLRLPFETPDGGVWELVVLPLEANATPVATSG